MHQDLRYLVTFKSCRLPNSACMKPCICIGRRLLLYSLVPRPCPPPGEKQSGKQSLISWAYYPKCGRTNEIARSIIFMWHFPHLYNPTFVEQVCCKTLLVIKAQDDWLCFTCLTRDIILCVSTHSILSLVWLVKGHTMGVGLETSCSVCTSLT